MGGRRLTVDDINSRIRDRGLRLVGNLVNTRTTALFKCSEGHTWSSNPSNVMSGSGCPICSNNQKLTEELVNSKLDHRGIKVIGHIKGSLVKTSFKCTQGHIWSARPRDVLYNSGCPECARSPDKETYLYVLESTQGTKIGVSTSPLRRVKQIIQASNIMDLAIKYLYKFSSASPAYDLEWEAHNFFADKNSQLTNFDGCTEFFNVLPEEVRDFFYREFGMENCHV